MGTKRDRKKNQLKGLVEVHARLFPEDVAKVKHIAATKLIPWQTELRLLVHRALDINIANGERSTPP